MSAALEEIALALTAVAIDPRRVQLGERLTIRVRSRDHQRLLYDCVNAIVLAMHTRSMLFGCYEVDVRDGVVDAVACGELVDVARHDPAADLRGATTSTLRLEEPAPGQWIATCVVDVQRVTSRPLRGIEGWQGHGVPPRSIAPRSWPSAQRAVMRSRAPWTDARHVAVLYTHTVAASLSVWASACADPSHA